MRKKTRRPGFTLIELMIVVAVIGILAAIAIPKFAELIRKSREGTTKGNLGALRGALSIYYGDMEGGYPVDLGSLASNAKYMAVLPTANVPDYHGANSLFGGWHGGCSPNFSSGDDFNARGWGYCATPGDPLFGTIVVNCTHTDSKGVIWTTY